MLRLFDAFLNRYTMYTVTIRGLFALALVAIILGFAHVLFYSGISLVLSLGIVLLVCEGTNRIFARLFRASPSVESAGITALILFFLLPPAATWLDAGILGLASIAAIASKYLFAWRKQHIFNPAAAGAAIIGFTTLSGATWWVATSALLPFVAVVGIMMVRKTRRFPLFLSGILASFLTILFVHISAQGAPLPPEEAVRFFGQIFTAWPIVFFCCVMLTEPSTAPAKKHTQIWYGIFVGVLSNAAVHIGPVYSTPEVSLLIGNFFFFLLHPKERLLLTLKEKTQVAKDLYHFVFFSPRLLAFEPGQYLEWTLPHEKSDVRGNRRFFTIASAPTEGDLAIGVKIQEKSSSFKKALATLKPGDLITAAQLSGDFTLPKDPKKKLVFIAGGIGITPFRSQIQELVTTEKPRDITLFYAAMTADEFAYEPLWLEAQARIGLHFVRLISKPSLLPSSLTPAQEEAGRSYTGYLTADILQTEVPDFKTRIFFLSGPQTMVTSYKTLLRKMGVSRRHIKTDYFPGF